MLLSELQAKDIISVKNGNNLGRIVDAKVDNDGKVTYFLAQEKKFFKKVTRNADITFTFSQIEKIGEDVILINI